MKSPWLAKADKSKCDYDKLTPDEIKKLKHHGYDPHDLKDGDPKRDLYKCKPSGKVVVMRKTKYQDPKKGSWVFPDEGEIEDTGIDINDLSWEKKRTTMIDEEIIEFRVSGFSDSPSKILDDLGIIASDAWEIGDLRSPKTKLKHKENGFRIVAGRQDLDFEERVRDLLNRVYPHRQKLAELGGRVRLLCVLYFSGSERPAVSFPKEVVGQLAELGASMDVDLYYLGDQEVAETPGLHV